MAQAATPAAAPLAVLALAFFAMAAEDISFENNMVARTDHVMIRLGTRFPRGPQNEPKA
jgi:hypothetical protein